MRVVLRGTFVGSGDGRFEIRQPKGMSSSASSEKFLSVDFYKSGSCTLIVQFGQDVISCETQVVYFDRDWSVLIRRK